MTTVTSPTHEVSVVVKQGDDHPLVWPVLEGTVAQDVTGWTAHAQVRTSDGHLLHTWSTDDGSAVCDADGVSLLLDGSAGWTWRYGYFDVVATRPDGVDVVPVQGFIKLTPLRTRR